MSDHQVEVTTVTEKHMALAKNIVATLRENVTPLDTMIVLCCACVVVAAHSPAPADAIDHALAILSQSAPDHRGQLAKAVLDAIADSMERAGV